MIIARIVAPGALYDGMYFSTLGPVNNPEKATGFRNVQTVPQFIKAGYGYQYELIEVEINNVASED